MRRRDAGARRAIEDFRHVAVRLALRRPLENLELPLPQPDCRRPPLRGQVLLIVVHHLVIDGHSASPLAVADEHGNVTVVDTVDNTWAEKIARPVAVEMGAISGGFGYPVTVKDLKEAAILGTVSFAEVARAAHGAGQLPPDMEPGFAETAVYQPTNQTFPNGIHLCEVEIDPETGLVVLERYGAVDDFGVVLNPMIVEGQVHGGVAQGIGQALHEGCVYDADSGQLLTGSLMDYQMPRAGDLPSFAVAFNEVPCRTNPLGIKGCGEAGAIVAPSTVINAVVDALAPLGVTHVEMPATPERVWRAIEAARAGVGR